MRCRLVLALITALAAQSQPASLTLEVRVFDGHEEVTPQARLTVHRAGERQESIPVTKGGDARVALQVPQGIYDVQAIHERDGKVINIRWANRLVVMPYPDEQGHHLEVINFRNGFGALQVRGDAGHAPSVALYEQGKRTKPAATSVGGSGYALFVVPAGTYDLQVRSETAVTWMPSIEVPLDRTRLTVLPKGDTPGPGTER
jgi:hypothetical protein